MEPLSGGGERPAGRMESLRGSSSSRTGDDEKGIELRDHWKVPPQSEATAASETRAARHLTVESDPRHVMRIIQSVQSIHDATGETPSLVRPHHSLLFYFRKVFNIQILLTVLGTCLALAWVKLAVNPVFVYARETQPESSAYLTIMGVIICVVLLSGGWAPWKVFSGFVAVLGALRVIKKEEILDGFSKDGAWIPQFLIIIISAIRESGVLEEALSYFLGTRRFGRHGRAVSYIRLQCACAVLALLVGAGPAITTAAPIVMRWAVCEGFECGPPLLLLVISATCGSVMLVSSSPISIVIRDIMTAGSAEKIEITATMPCALAIFAALSAYSLRFTPGVDSAAPATLDLTCDGGAGSGSSGSAGAARAEEKGGGGGEAELEKGAEDEGMSRLRYKLEFVVKECSAVIGMTPQTVGIRLEDGVQLLMICRSGGPDSSAVARRISFCRRRSVGERLSQAMPAEWLAKTSDPEEMRQWEFEAGDVMVAQCSVQGVIAMRRNPGVFALRGLHCNDLLGGKRHMRRLYECVLAQGSPLVGQTLEEILGLNKLVENPLSLAPKQDVSNAHSAAVIRNALQLAEAPSFLKQHLGYPLAGFRRSSGLQAPLSLSGDALRPGDVLLVDAFEDFPTLQPTAKNFLVVSLVPNSQAPRHGRGLDKMKGIAAICIILGADLLVDLAKFPLVLGSLIGAILCVVMRTVQVHQVLQLLSWPMLLTFGSGAGVSHAITKTGVANAIVQAINYLGQAFGTQGKLFALAVVAQVMANILSNAPAGLIVAPLAIQVAEEDDLLSPESVCILVVITCNMALSTPFATGSNAAIGSLAGFSHRHFLRFGLPAQAIVTLIVVEWTWFCAVLTHAEQLKAAS